MKKTDLIHKLKQLTGISDEERAYLINLVNTKKKYGLVWEDKPEDVEEQLRDNLPVLKEVKDKAIINGEEYPNHILIEGDNLHALTALTFTHEGKIDVIYIDPPYNTGNKDFKYNDTFVDKEDSYRHSKWLSFMSKRLEIAKRLLSDSGVIFISIDDYEQATLKLLCDEVFSEINFVGNIIWQRSYAPINLKKTISQNHDFILSYCKKDFSLLEFNKLPRSEEAISLYKNPDNDSRGPWQSDNFSVGPAVAEKLYEIKLPSGRIVTPPHGRCWLLTKDRYQEFLKDNRIWFGKDGNGVPRIKRFLSEVRDGVVAMSLWTHSEVGHTQDAKRELKEVLHESSKPFETVKPIKLINRILNLKTDQTKSYKILDFFAGSGTTLHATMQLNAEDGGNRQCILVTNNENNICEEVTYERNKRVIEGYTNSKGEKVDGLANNNLRYYKSEFVGREPSIKNKKEITRLATELLCIKEDIYNEQKQIGGYQLNATYVRCFQQGQLYLLVIYDEDVIEQMVEVIQSVVTADTDRNTHFKVYVFSNGQYPYTEEFEEVLPYITLCALPDAIYKAYQNVLPKRQRPQVPELEEPTAEEVENQLINEEVNLFNQR
ncbi:MAG: site-specific DNA-methyltransferase [Verrucomicrobia bacterium]|nr:site-specific DNA-methyltransferase [Verrucomicrobiota bacterium]